MKCTLILLLSLIFTLKSYSQIFLYSTDCSELTVELEKNIMRGGGVLLLETEVLPGVWYKSQEKTINTLSTTFIVEDKRMYRVSLIDRELKTSTITISNTAKTACLKLEESVPLITTQPNPVTDILHVHFAPEVSDKSIDYQIYNSMGIRLTEGIFTSNSNSIDVSNFVTGVYMLKCNLNNLDIVEQFVVQF